MLQLSMTGMATIPKSVAFVKENVRSSSSIARTNYYKQRGTSNATVAKLTAD
jgi:hypothetical protein